MLLHSQVSAEISAVGVESDWNTHCSVPRYAFPFLAG